MRTFRNSYEDNEKSSGAFLAFITANIGLKIPE